MKITKPTMLLDEKKCRMNIEKMIEKAKSNNLDLQPHYKTHQSTEVGKWFKEYGIKKITVSSVSMAEKFAEQNYEEITLAFPLNFLEIRKINELCLKTNFNIVLTSYESAEFLAEHAKNNIGCIIKIDVGNKRAGINPKDNELIDKILDTININNKISFKGFMGHDGHNYNSSKNDIRTNNEFSISIMKNLKETYGYEASLGDTPGSILCHNFEGIDILRPGNFVYFDLMQYYAEVCELKEIAVAEACPVVGKNEHREEIIIYGGAVHLSKEYVFNENGAQTFGMPVLLNKDLTWNEPIKHSYVKSLSQEHGIIQTSKKHFDDFQIGDLIGILPVHSCLTADLSEPEII